MRDSQRVCLDLLLAANLAEPHLAKWMKIAGLKPDRYIRLAGTREALPSTRSLNG
jgi:hypothetical protein